MTLKKIFNYVALSFMFIVLPIGSWYYLSKGFNFRKRQFAELKDYGKMPDFQFVTHRGDTLSKADLRGKIVVADFIFTRCTASCAAMSQEMTRVQEAFDDNPDVVILSHTIDAQHDSLPVLKAYAERYGAIDGKWFFLRGDQATTFQLAKEGYQLAANEGDVAEDIVHSPHFVLMDTSLTIRNYYNGTNKDEVNKMIVHISMIMPKPKSKVKFMPDIEM